MPQVNQSRRDFLKSSAGIVAASTLAGSMLSSSVYAAGDETIKTRADRLRRTRQRRGRPGSKHQRTRSSWSPWPTRLKTTPGASLKNLKNEHPRPCRCEGRSRLLGFDAYQKARRSTADMVILATPPGFRPIHFEAAVAAGKNVFMEKPVSHRRGRAFAGCWRRPRKRRRRI